MNVADAEEYTQALGQVAAGAWRQIALGERLGVPTTLGLSTREWVEQRLGGYVRLSIEDRREAVAELSEEGHSQRKIADVLGVDQKTVSNDLRSPEENSSGEPEAPRSEQPLEENSSFDPDLSPEPEQPSEAVTEFLESSEDLQQARYRAEFMKVLVRANAVMEFDPAKLGEVSDVELAESIDAHAARVSEFAARFRKARRNLRVISGASR